VVFTYKNIDEANDSEKGMSIFKKRLKSKFDQFELNFSNKRKDK